ncbi:MAG: HAD-IA family hydrolase [Phycisphaerales bacterium]|nr:HAD-IA family hydrolase [Phycisphaerales bacterium]
MSSLDIIRDRIELITFDCYGTLVDWETGIRSALRGIWDSDDPAVFDAYLDAEAEIELRAYRPYRQVQADAVRLVADRLGRTVPPGREHALSQSLPDWPLWPDTNAALQRLKSRYRIGVLSNIDRDLFAGTQRHLSVTPDLLITAQDVGSYKPAAGHFKRMLESIGGDSSRVLHAAQSLFHDCVPTTQMGIANVWINRRNEVNATAARPMAVFRDVAGLADALGV